MALFPDPLTSIFAAIDTQNGITLDPTQYSVGTPTPNNDATGVTNTSLTLTPNTSQCPYTGAVTVNYFRWQLTDLAKQLPLPLKFNGLSSSLQMALKMNDYYGTNFSAADIIDNAVTVAGDGSGTLTLTAQSTSLGWVGSVDLPFILGNFDLSTIITPVALPGLVYPDRDASRPFAEMYSYWRDFSPQESLLVSHTSADTDVTDIATALTQSANNAQVTWVTSGASRYSLANASITYNGTTAGYPTYSNGDSQVNLDYTNVMVVQLDPTENTGYSGSLFMHYNVPL